MNYLEYFKRQKLRNRQRKAQNKIKETHEGKKKKQTNQGSTSKNVPSLVFHGINVQRCRNTPKIWCSLNRLSLSPWHLFLNEYGRVALYLLSVVKTEDSDIILPYGLYRIQCICKQNWKRISIFFILSLALNQILNCHGEL